MQWLNILTTSVVLNDHEDGLWFSYHESDDEILNITSRGSLTAVQLILFYTAAGDLLGIQPEMMAGALISNVTHLRGQ